MSPPVSLWQTRLRLAGVSLLVMGAILYGAGWGMARLLLQSKQAAMERELRSLGDTLHDSLKPLLPSEARPGAELETALRSALPGLCVVGRPCREPSNWAGRHALGAADPGRFGLRMLDPQGQVLAHSPGLVSPSPQTLQPGSTTRERPDQTPQLAYTIHLHRSHGDSENDWGYLQISRSLAPLTAETRRLWWLGHGVFGVALLGAALASWWLAGLALAPLLAAYRQQEQFSADAAHELRAPLANLLALVEAEPSSPVLERVLHQGRRLQGLISDLLLLASREQPARRLPAQELCPLSDLVEDLVQDFSELARAEGVRLRLDGPSEPIGVAGNASELSRLLANLLANAIHHSPRGGLVTVTLQPQAGAILLAVADQGPGLTPQEQERIFERFYRSDSGRSRRKGGTGLGLAIVQAIARRHGTWVGVQSAPGAGSTFSLQLQSLAGGPLPQSTR